MFMKEYVNPFEFQENDPIIACVGDNGGTDNEVIKSGFQRTANILIEMSNTCNETEDTLVYPLVYNARHSIELALKIIIEQLWKLQELKGSVKSDELIKLEKKKLHCHDIKILFEMVESLVEIDRRLPSCYKGIEPLVEFYYFDKDGDAFKYETDVKGVPHMSHNKISYICINTFGEQFNYIMRKLDNMIYFLKNCIREYQLRTFTKNLSREDIENISRLLPKHEKWHEKQFNEIKDEVKREYNISNNEFSKALDIIRAHRRFCVNIGLEKPFLEIPKGEFEAYAVMVHQAIIERQREEEGNYDLWSLSNSLIVSQEQRKYEVKIQISTLNLLLTFSEMGNTEMEAEMLEQVFEFHSKSAYSKEYMIRKLRSEQSCKKIIVGLRKCGQLSYENRLLNSLHNQGINVEIQETVEDIRINFNCV